MIWVTWLLKRQAPLWSEIKGLLKYPNCQFSVHIQENQMWGGKMLFKQYPRESWDLSLQVVKRSGKHSLQGGESLETLGQSDGPEKTVGEDQCWLESADYLLWAIFACQWLGEELFRGNRPFHGKGTITLKLGFKGLLSASTLNFEEVHWKI